MSALLRGPLIRSRLLDFGMVGGTSYSAEALAVFAAFTTPPSDPRKAAIDTLITDLIAAGVWSKIDILHVYAAADSQASLINWKAPGTFNATAVNSPTFTADVGYAFDGITTSIDTNFNPSTAGGGFARDSAFFAILSSNSAQDVISAGWWDGSDGVTLQCRSGANIITGRINQAGNTNYAANADGTGLYAINRSGASATQMYKDGAAKGTGSVASTALNNHTLTLGKWGASNFEDSAIRLDTAGSSLTSTEHADFSTAVAAYIAAL